MSKLKTCPFCNGEARRPMPIFPSTGCKNKDCCLYKADIAVHEWNKRAEDESDISHELALAQLMVDVIDYLQPAIDKQRKKFAEIIKQETEKK